MGVSIPCAFITAAVGFAGAFTALERTRRAGSAAVNRVTFAGTPSRAGAGLVTVGTLAAAAGSRFAVAPAENGVTGTFPPAGGHIAGIAAFGACAASRLGAGASARARIRLGLFGRNFDIANFIGRTYNIAEARADIAIAAEARGFITG